MRALHCAVYLAVPSTGPGVVQESESTGQRNGATSDCIPHEGQYYGVSTSRACEIGLAQFGNITYQHIAYILLGISEQLK